MHFVRIKYWSVDAVYFTCTSGLVAEPAKTYQLTQAHSWVSGSCEKKKKIEKEPQETFNLYLRSC